MLYLMEVTEDKYKIYDSESKDVFIKDGEFVDREEVSGVITRYLYRPFNERELKLANLLELISISERRYFCDYVPWVLDTTSLVCYWNKVYINLMTLLIHIFVNHTKVYTIDGDILTVYLQEQIVIFKIKDRTKFELLRTKLVVFYKSAI